MPEEVKRCCMCNDVAIYINNDTKEYLCQRCAEINEVARKSK